MDKTQSSIVQKKTETIAKKAGEILLKYRKRGLKTKKKGNRLDIVTDADLASEKYIIKQIRKQFPDHSIYSEEFGEELIRSDYTWVIDPLDGTKDFARGLPNYNVSIALEYKNKLIAGVVYRPATGELFSVSKKNGAFLNNYKIRVSTEKEIKNSFIWTYIPNYKNAKDEINATMEIYKKLIQKAYRLRSNTETVAALAWLSMGALEGYILSVTSPLWYDVAPGILMVKEAGGEVTDVNGNKIKNRDLSNGLVATNGLIHEELLGYLKYN